MTTYRNADEAFLRNYDNRENRPLDYAAEALLWFKNQDKKKSDWFEVVPDRFMSAVDSALHYFISEPGTDRAKAFLSMTAKLAEWKNDIDNPVAHPLSTLENILVGQPGEFLEFGPMLPLTITEVIEGAAHEYFTQMAERDEDYLAMLALLSLLALSAVAESCFWATLGTGSNLRVELGRVFSGDPTDLRGQLATLSLSGTALAWGEHVEFVSESRSPTPDFLVRRASDVLFVECTTSGRICKTTNDLSAMGDAIARAWNEKRVKFEEREFQPGLVTVDLSGIPVDRKAGVHLLTERVSKHTVTLGPGRVLTIGISDARSDFELMTHENWTRGPIALASTALNSKYAVEHNILGLLTHYGQDIVIDGRRRSVHRPIRNMLFWRGDPHSPWFDMALRVALQPVSNHVPEHRIPPVFVQLV